MDAVVISKKFDCTYSTNHLNPITKLITTMVDSNKYIVTTYTKSSIKLNAIQTKSINFNCTNKEKKEKRVKNKNDSCLALANLNEINDKNINKSKNNNENKVNKQTKDRENKINNEKNENNNKIYSLIKFLTRTLEEIIAINSENELNSPQDYSSQNKLEFYCEDIPEISILNYLERVIKLCRPEFSTCILLSIYIDRFCENSSFLLTINNIHKVLIAAFMAAIKFNEDKIFNNSHYSLVGGISPKELSTLEFRFLKLIDYDLYVHKSDFEKCLEYAEKNKV